MATIKISSLPPVDEFVSIQDYLNAKESGKLGFSTQYGDSDLFQMIRILEKQNAGLMDRVKKMESLVTPLG